MDNKLLVILQKQQSILKQIVAIEERNGANEPCQFDEYRSLVFELINATCQCAEFLRESIQEEQVQIDKKERLS